MPLRLMIDWMVVPFLALVTAVAQDTTVTVKATAGGVSKDAIILVKRKPAVLSSFICPTDVTEGDIFSCTATISRPAPSSGLLVTILISSPAVSCPAAVSVVPGATSAVLPCTAPESSVP